MRPRRTGPAHGPDRVRRSSHLLAVARRTGRLALNVLSAGQGALAGAFARKGTDKFAGVDWREEAGLPRLSGAGIWLACGVEAFLPGGDHVIVAATVTDGQVDATAAPLTYHRRRFGTHTAWSPAYGSPLSVTPRHGPSSAVRRAGRPSRP